MAELEVKSAAWRLTAAQEVSLHSRLQSQTSHRHSQLSHVPHWSEVIPVTNKKLWHHGGGLIMTQVLCGVKSVHYSQLALVPWVILQDRLLCWGGLSVLLRKMIIYFVDLDYPLLRSPLASSLWDLLRDSFLSFIYLSPTRGSSAILSIDIPQTDRQESRVGLNLVSQVGNKKLNKVLTNSLFYLRLEWLLHPAQRQFLPLDPCDEKLPLKSYIFGFAFNESYWNSK